MKRDLFIPPHVGKRAFDNFDLAENGCHISRYALVSNPRGGGRYCQIGWNYNGSRHATTAHRAAWVYVHGQIPVGMTVDHRPDCDRRCVNVDHLRLLSNFDNARRNRGRDWPIGNGECVNGHPLSEMVLVRKSSRSHRNCRLCMRMHQQAYAARQRARA